MIHAKTHPSLDVEGCYGCRLASFNVAPSAQPTRHPHAVEKKEMSKRWAMDLPAYARLVKNGVQPRSTEGTAFLEAHAETAAEVESGIILDDKQRRDYQARVA